MRKLFYSLAILLGFFLVASSIQESFADETWWLGENLEKEDYFSYELCYIDYNDCTPFQIEFWIEKKIEWDNETRWLVQVVVYDEKKIISGDVEFGTLAAEPIDWTPELEPYVLAFKSSVSWLATFASENYPKNLPLGSSDDNLTWNGIGKHQVLEVSDSEIIHVGSRSYDTVMIHWNFNNIEKKFWIADEFPFPIKADAKICGVDNIIYQEFKFELLEHRKNISDHPFLKLTHSSESTNLENNDIVEGMPSEDCTYTYTLEEALEIQRLRTGMDEPVPGPEPNYPDEITAEIVEEMKEMAKRMNLPPLKQFRDYEITNPYDINCKSGLDLIVKKSDGSPACVKPETAEKLIARGWAIS